MSMNLARCMDHGKFGCPCGSRLISVPSKLAREFWHRGERLVPESVIYARIHAHRQEAAKRKRPGTKRRREFERQSKETAAKWRIRTLERDDYTCKGFDCLSTEDLEVHHIHYETFGRETGRELITLCKWCHRDADKARERLRPHWERMIAGLEAKWAREHPAA